MMAAPPEGTGIELGDVTPDGRHVEATVTVPAPDAACSVLVLAEYVDTLQVGHPDRDGIIRAIDVLNAVTESTDRVEDLRYGDVVVDANGDAAVWMSEGALDGWPWLSLHREGVDGPWMKADAVEWPVSFVYRPTPAS